MSKIFSIKRVETVNYYLDYDREDVIDLMAFNLGEGDEAAEAAVKERLSPLTDEELLQAFEEELEEYGDVYEYVIERSEKYGDVQSQDVTVSLGKL